MEPATRYALSVGSVVIVVVGIFIASFIHITTFVGSNDSRVWLKDSITTVTIASLLAAAVTTAAGLTFYYMKPESIMYLLLFVAFMGFGLSWVACAIALIKRK
jgi:hypothetical protein